MVSTVGALVAAAVSVFACSSRTPKEDVGSSASRLGESCGSSSDCGAGERCGAGGECIPAGNGGGGCGGFGRPPCGGTSGGSTGAEACREPGESCGDAPEQKCCTGSNCSMTTGQCEFICTGAGTLCGPTNQGFPPCCNGLTCDPKTSRCQTLVPCFQGRCFPGVAECQVSVCYGVGSCDSCQSQCTQGDWCGGTGSSGGTHECRQDGEMCAGGDCCSGECDFWSGICGS